MALSPSLELSQWSDFWVGSPFDISALSHDVDDVNVPSTISILGGEASLSPNTGGGASSPTPGPYSESISAVPLCSFNSGMLNSSEPSALGGRSLFQYPTESIQDYSSSDSSSGPSAKKKCKAEDGAGCAFSQPSHRSGDGYESEETIDAHSPDNLNQPCSLQMADGRIIIIPDNIFAQSLSEFNCYVASLHPTPHDRENIKKLRRQYQGRISSRTARDKRRRQHAALKSALAEKERMVERIVAIVQLNVNSHLTEFVPEEILSTFMNSISSDLAAGGQDSL